MHGAYGYYHFAFGTKAGCWCIGFQTCVDYKGSRLAVVEPENKLKRDVLHRDSHAIQKGRSRILSRFQSLS